MARLTYLTTWILAGVLAASASAAPPSLEALGRWLRDLDADDHSVREAASREMVNAGSHAVEVLARGVVSDHPEVAWRASEALQQIALQGDDTTFARAVAALEGASRAGQVGAAEIARDLRIRQRKLRHDRAVARLQGLGAKVPPAEQPLTAWLEGGFGGVVGAPVAVELDLEGEPIVEIVDGVEELGPGRPVLAEAHVNDVEAPEKPLPLEALEKTLTRLAALTEEPEQNPTLDEPSPAIDAPDAEASAADGPGAEVVVESSVAPVAADPEAGETAVAEDPAEQITPVATAEPPLVETPLEEPAPPPDDIPLHVEDEVMVDISPDAMVEIFIGDAFGSDFVAPSANGLTQSLVLDAEWQGGDDGLAALAELPSLVRLRIDHAPLTDAALPHLAALSNLRELEISNTGISPAGLSKLRAQAKELRIIARGPALLGVHAEQTGLCRLTGIAHGSAAEAAGLQIGDEVVGLGGLKVRDFSDLMIALYDKAPGETLKVHVRRGGKPHTVEVVLKSRGD